MRRKIVYTLLIAFLMSMGAWSEIGKADLQAQDPIFSQFYAAPMQLNPAFSGNSFAPRFTFNHRTQWPSISSAGAAYSTYAGAYDQFIEKANSGIGLMVLTDDAGAGILKTTKISGLYSYRVRLNTDWFAKIGVEAGFVQSNLDWNRLTFGDQLDPEFGSVTPGGSVLPTGELPPEDLSQKYLDFGAGILFYSDVYYGGVSLKHLNRPDDGFAHTDENLGGVIPMRYTVHGGIEYVLRPALNKQSEIFISPNVLYANQGPFNQLNIGSYISFGTLFGGAWYRHTFGNPDAVIGLVGVRFNQLKIGYSYDVTISGLNLSNTGGSHEVSLSIDFTHDRKVNYNDCFRMFR